MGDYNAYRHGDPNAIEMGMPGQRIPTNQSSTTFSNNDAYVKNEHSLDDDPNEIATDYQPVNWKRVFFSKKYLPVWIILIIVGIITAIITLKHDQVVDALRPFAEKVRDIPAGWLIFVAVLFIISFPPLFGHELVALLAGVVYGLWIGFAVVAGGTFIGEIGTWFAFKKLFRKKAEKMERTNLTYGAMAKLCRDGGFWMVFVIRLSIVPSHMSTAVFSTCDVRFWHFAVSTFFTLPKQLILVYLGVLLVGGQSDFWIKFGLFGVAGLITVLSGVWIWWKMRAIKKDLIVKQDAQRARQALQRNNSYNNQAEMQSGAPATSWQHQQQQQQQQKQQDATAMGGAYASEFEREQAEVYESYRPQKTTPAPTYYPDNDGDLGTRYQAYSPPGQAYSQPGQAFSQPGQAYTTHDAYPATSTSPSTKRYQASVASVQDSPEQTKAREPHGFI